MVHTQSELKEQYLRKWCDNYCYRISQLRKEIGVLIVASDATPIDKKALDAIKLLLQRPEINSIIEDLSNGDTIKKATLDSIEKIEKDLVDLLIEYLPKSKLLCTLAKQNAHYNIEIGKQLEIIRLNALQISIVE